MFKNMLAMTKHISVSKKTFYPIALLAQSKNCHKIVIKLSQNCDNS